MKNILSILLASMMVLVMSVGSFASPYTKGSMEEIPLEESLAAFDLTKHEVQEQTVMVNGEACTVVLKPVGPQTRTNSYDLSDGQWEIYWYGITINFKYYIDIENSRIVDAYDESCFLFMYELVSDDLSYTSTKAEYRVEATGGIADFNYSYSGALVAKISGDQLLTYVV